MVTLFIVKSRAFIAAKAPMIDAGIAVERQERMKNKTITLAIRLPAIKWF
jgi:hypothetical protein